MNYLWEVTLPLHCPLCSGCDTASCLYTLGSSLERTGMLSFDALSIFLGAMLQCA